MKLLHDSLQACNLLGIRDKEFREGNSKTLKEAFSKTLDEALRPKKTPSKVHLGYHQYQKQKEDVKRGKRAKSTELQLIHEAYQYLLKRKSFQVARYPCYSTARNSKIRQ